MVELRFLLLVRSASFLPMAPIRAIAVALFVAACGSASSGSPTGSTCPSTSALTYANFGQAFIETNCLACHASREKPNLASQAAIQSVRDQIDSVAAAGPNAVNTVMPKGGSVSQDERKKLGEWLACGAP